MAGPLGAEEARRVHVRRAWKEEVALSSRLTTSVVFACILHLVAVHLFGLFYLMFAPKSLRWTRPAFLGLRCFDVLLIAAVLLVVWALCHAFLLRSRRWRVQHAISLAVLVVSTLGTVRYALVFRQFDAYFRADVEQTIERIDRELREVRWEGDSWFLERRRALLVPLLEEHE